MSQQYGVVISSVKSSFLKMLGLHHIGTSDSHSIILYGTAISTTAKAFPFTLGFIEAVMLQVPVLILCCKKAVLTARKVPSWEKYQSATSSARLRKSYIRYICVLCDKGSQRL